MYEGSNSFAERTSGIEMDMFIYTCADLIIIRYLQV